MIQLHLLSDNTVLLLCDYRIGMYVCTVCRLGLVTHVCLFPLKDISSSLFISVV